MLAATYAVATVIITFFTYYGIVSFIDDIYNFLKQVRATPVAA